MITNICSHELCTGCGTCVGICDNDALTMRETSDGTYHPVIDSKKCTQCEKCIRVCPEISSDFVSLNEFVFNKNPADVLLGNYINCYLGLSTDAFIRWNASSGGLVTTLLKFALDEKIIDGALVVRMSLNYPLRPEVLVARSSKEILSSMGSKYCPAPSNVMLKELLDDDGKFAVVGLPCHIQGLRKAEILDKRLRKKIVLHIGLFCAHTVDFRGTEFILRKLGAEKEDVLRISYRGRGWPGGLTVRLKSGKGYFMPYSEYYVFRYFLFTPFACTLCSDGTAEFADISFGDAWLPENKEEKIGKSVVVSRSEIGERILQEAYMKNKVVIRKTNRRTVITSQREQLYFKKRSLSGYIRILSMFKKRAPACHLKPLNHNIITYGAAMLPFIGTIATSNPLFLRMLEFLPFSLLVTYNKLISTFGKALFEVQALR